MVGISIAINACQYECVDDNPGEVKILKIEI